MRLCVAGSWLHVHCTLAASGASAEVVVLCRALVVLLLATEHVLWLASNMAPHDRTGQHTPSGCEGGRTGCTHARTHAAG